MNVEMNEADKAMRHNLRSGVLFDNLNRVVEAIGVNEKEYKKMGLPELSGGGMLRE